MYNKSSFKSYTNKTHSEFTGEAERVTGGNKASLF